MQNEILGILERGWGRRAGANAGTGLISIANHLVTDPDQPDNFFRFIS